MALPAAETRAAAESARPSAVPSARPSARDAVGPGSASAAARGDGSNPSGPAKEGGAEERARRDGPRRDGGRRRGPRGRPGALAALDLGTNNCRLLVARPQGEGFQVIDAFSRVVRLGEGLSETGRLSEAAIDRAVAALSICADRLKRHRVHRFRAIATEACRRAANQRAFLDRVRAETGLSLDVIRTEEEARLAVAGCAPLVDPSAEQLLVFDIGGGSTELIWIDLSRTSSAKRKALLMALAHGASRSDRARAAAQHITDWVSLPVGVVTLMEKYDYIIDDGEKFEAMYAHVSELIAPFAVGGCAPTRELLSKLQMLGTSGTITTLAGVHLELERYSRRAVDGLWISTQAVDKVIESLVEMNAYERAAIPCVGEDRCTNLMSGAAILRAILRIWPTRRLRVADRGLREGMLYGLIQDGQRRGRAEPSGRRGEPVQADPSTTKGSRAEAGAALDPAPAGEAGRTLDPAPAKDRTPVR
ncbi:MAG: Ppx/GppA phosphatase family protein [Pseudomonadota bacterium]